MRHLALFLILAGACAAAYGLEWHDDSAMAARITEPVTVFEGLLIGGQSYNMSNAGNGLVYFDGKTVRLGSQPAAWRWMKGIDRVGIFAWNQTAGSVGIQKALNETSTWSNVLTVTGDGLNATGVLTKKNLVDCGRHDIGGTVKRVLLYVEYGTGANEYACKIWCSAEAADADAGNSGTWFDLFSPDSGTTPGICPGIRHWHGGTYIPDKGLYLFSGDGTNNGGSILFCPEAEIGDLVGDPLSAVGDGANFFTEWGLGAGSRAAWDEDTKSDYILLAGKNYPVDLVSADNRKAYFIRDHNADAGKLNEIWKVDLYDTTDSAAGTLTSLGEATPNWGWCGGASASGMVYLTTIAYASVETSNGQAEIIAIDPETDEWRVVKRIAPQGPVTSSIQIHEPLEEYGGSMFSAVVHYGGGNRFESTDRWSGAMRTVFGRVAKQKQPGVNVLTNGSFAAGETDWVLGSSMRQIIIKTGLAAGETKVVNGATVTGLTSGAAATLDADPYNTGGTWAGNDWAGHLRPGTWTGDFEQGEILTVDGVNVATVDGYILYSIIDSPVAGWSGKVCRIAAAPRNLRYRPEMRPQTTDKTPYAVLVGREATFSLRMYIDPSSQYTDADFDPRVILWPTPTDNMLMRTKTAALPKGQWIRPIISGHVARTATGQYYMLQPFYNYNHAGTYTLYVTDFQLVPGAIANDEIEPIADLPAEENVKKGPIYGTIYGD